jgi:hypothetical protein
MDKPVFDEEFFRDLKERLRRLGEALMPAPGIALVVFTILLFIVVLQQFLLILLYNK